MWEGLSSRSCYKHYYYYLSRFSQLRGHTLAMISLGKDLVVHAVSTTTTSLAVHTGSNTGKDLVVHAVSTTTTSLVVHTGSNTGKDLVVRAVSTTTTSLFVHTGSNTTTHQSEAMYRLSA